MRGFWHTLPIRDRETLLEVCEELTPDIRRRWALRKQKQIEAKLLRIDEDCRLRDRVEQRNAAILDSVPRIQTLDALEDEERALVGERERLKMLKQQLRLYREVFRVREAQPRFFRSTYATLEEVRDKVRELILLANEHPALLGA
eukprot:8229885-Prorocentrum_lima.AAC.1